AEITKLAERISASTQVFVRVRKIDRFTDQRDARAAQIRFAQSRIEHRRFDAWVCANQKDHISLIYAGDRRVEEIALARPLTEERAERTAIGVRRADGGH